MKDRGGRGEPKLPLPAAMRLGRHRGPGRVRVASDPSIRTAPEGSGRFVKSLACQSPDLRITPWKGGLAFQASWRRIRTFDSQIKCLMLYPLSYPWSRQRESNPRPPDYVRRSTTELGPQPISLQRRRTQDRQCRLCGRRRKLQPLRSFQVCDRDRADTACVRLSQAALWWRNRGFLRRWHFRNSQILAMALAQPRPNSSSRLKSVASGRFCVEDHQVHPAIREICEIACGCLTFGRAEGGYGWHRRCRIRAAPRGARRPGRPAARPRPNLPRICAGRGSSWQEARAWKNSIGRKLQHSSASCRLQ